MSTKGHVVIAGASGVIGSAAVEHFAAQPNWEVTALSRRRPHLPDGLSYRFLTVDLQDSASTAATLTGLPPVTHLIYAASKEARGLVGGWSDGQLIDENGHMFANLLDPLTHTGRLRHVCLLQGTKAYGAHQHPIQLPLREDMPRDGHANFYWLHEDHLRQSAGQANFAWTIFRPQVLFGSAAAVAMNPALAVGAYAALCHELQRPFVLPGAGESIGEFTDSRLLAAAFDWAFEQPAARAQTYNITNGDVFVWAHAWPAIANHLGLNATGTGAAPTSLEHFFATPTAQAAWQNLARRFGLKIPDLHTLLGESHHYFDLLTSARVSAKSAPPLLSTIKIRQDGFARCIDSLASLHYWLARMAQLNILPPLPFLRPDT